MSTKKFQDRNSALSDLYNNDEGRIVYNVMFLIFFQLFVTIIEDDFQQNRLTFGLEPLILAFGKFHISIIVWCLYFISTCLIFCIFEFWTQNPKWPRFWCILLVTYYFLSFSIAQSVVRYFQLPPGNGCIILGEQTRFLMKIHSFIRTNAPKVKSSQYSATFSKYFYFLFAPTLIYQDAYPRRNRIDVKNALSLLGQFFLGIICWSFVVKKILFTPQMLNFGLRTYRVTEIFWMISENIFLALLMMLCAHWVVLHSCQNFFAELTRFSDRSFYSDWWKSADYGTWFRKWNLLVHEWLSIYIYRDVMKFVYPNRNLALLCVFLISGLVHEWIIMVLLGSYPFLLVSYPILGILLVRMNGRDTNTNYVLIKLLNCIGVSAFTILYGIEFIANRNVPFVRTSLWDILLPRFCNFLEY